MVKNPPTNAGDRSDPWSGRIPRVMGQLSPSTVTTEAPEPRACDLSKRGHHNEKPAHCNRAAYTHCNYRKLARSNEHPAQPKINNTE